MARKPAHEQFDTLKAIQDCAFDLFGRYGYDGVSIGDISTAAKLSTMKSTQRERSWSAAYASAKVLDIFPRFESVVYAAPV